MRVSRSIVLPTTAQEAWDVLMDWERQADWMLDADSVTVVSDIREGVGVLLAVRTRLFGVPAFTEPMEVTRWEPPRRMMIRHGSAVSGTGTWDLEPVEGGVRFTWTEDIRLAVPVGGDLAARCYGPILRLLMGRAMDGLRRHLIAIGPARPQPA
jgi:carbon monoxide dehydrogenase subunit G